MVDAEGLGLNQVRGEGLGKLPRLAPVLAERLLHDHAVEARAGPAVHVDLLHGLREEEGWEGEVEDAVILRASFAELPDPLVEGLQARRIVQADGNELHLAAEVLQVLGHPALLLLEVLPEPLVPEVAGVGDVRVEGGVVAADDRHTRRQAAGQVELEDGRERLLFGQVPCGTEHDQGVVVLRVDAQLHDGDVAVLEDVVEWGDWHRGHGLLGGSPCPQHQYAVGREHDPRGLHHLPPLGGLGDARLVQEGLLHPLPGRLRALLEVHHDVLRPADHLEVHGDPLRHLEAGRVRAEHAHRLPRGLRPALRRHLVPLGEDARDVHVVAEREGHEVGPVLLLQQGAEAPLVVRGAGVRGRQAGVGRDEAVTGQPAAALRGGLHQGIGHKAGVAVLVGLEAVALVHEEHVHPPPVDQRTPRHV
mmetsp:Transcript_42912/g.121423  ORF Transcript_42912/g.121423 Transcript_42912/m.121423 type:complete len:419 (-) Transcript_42912:252-1508(-)